MGSIVTRTVLLTDIVGSTSLVETLGDAPAAALLGKVDRAVRDAVANSGGVEIDKTDGFLVLFDRAVDAVRCATRIHAALADISRGLKRPIAMRCGINVGEVVLRHNSPEDVARGAKPIEVEGLTKPMAARIMSIASGGQTLLTRPAHELASRASVGDPELGTMRYTAHGLYRLAGVSEPIEVFEVSLKRPKRLAVSEKVQPARRRRPLRTVLVLALLLGVVGAAGWMARPLWPTELTRTVDRYVPHRSSYTSLAAPARVSIFPSVQSGFVAVWDAFGQGDLRTARQRADDLAGDLPNHPDVRLTQLWITLTEQGWIPPALHQDVAEGVGSGSGANGELLAFVERWKVEGWHADKLHDDVHRFRERYPDHRVGLLVSISLHQEQQRTEEIASLADELVGSQLAALGWRLRAEDRVRAGDLAAAQAAYVDALKQFPDHPLLVRGSAALRWENGDPAGALELLAPMVERDPNDLAARASIVAALLGLGREAEIEPHLAAAGVDGAHPPHARVWFGREVAAHLAFHGRLARARELLAAAQQEARTAQLSDPFVDGLLLDLGWALDPHLTGPTGRAKAVERAEQGLLEPWLSEAAGRRLRDYLTSARALDAWLNGDETLLRQLGAALAQRSAAADPFGAPSVVRTLDAKAETSDGGCGETLASGEVWAHGGGEQSVEASRAAFSIVDQPACEGSYHLQPEKAGAEAHLASLAADEGEFAIAADRAAAFRVRWPNADPELPVVKMVSAVEAQIRYRSSGDGRDRHADKRRKSK